MLACLRNTSPTHAVTADFSNGRRRTASTPLSKAAANNSGLNNFTTVAEQGVREESRADEMLYFEGVRASIQEERS